MNCQAEYREEDGWVDAERERERERLDAEINEDEKERMNALFS
jgi:hypothetical protein